ncbi:MAG TPA: carbohydrate kinase family protein [Candidatus Limnocylindrales bacterium]|nr:carbohydrate kinase family protein [Candidatus Limnocylindrales bacterium]
MADARVVCIGLATLDVIVVVDRLPRTDDWLPASDASFAGGGPAPTAAVALARLGVPVAFVGSVGTDDAGRRVRDELAAEGVDVSACRLVDGTTPFSVILVEQATGARSIVPWAGSARLSALDDASVTMCREAEWVHVDHVAITHVRDLRARAVTARISLDAGNPIADPALDAIDLYAPTEAALLARYPTASLADALRAAVDEGPAIAVATRGANGSCAAIRSDDGAVRIVEAPGFPVEVVSTLGAGDVFHGALLSAIAGGDSIDAALPFANAAAALSCRALDGRSAIPRRDELERFLASAGTAASVSEGGRRGG